MTNGQISEFLLLLDRKTEITSHSVTDWRSEYAEELKTIEKQLSVLRVAADQDRGRGSADSASYVPTMVSIAEASRRTGLSSDHLRKLVLGNKIKYVRAGSKYLINLDRLVEYLDTGDQEANV